MVGLIRVLVVLAAILAAAAPPLAAQSAPPAAPAQRAQPPGVRGTEAQLRDAWLASDAVVVGTYGGVDSALGPDYHVLQAAEIWLGSPTPGRLVFKAPRGMRGRRGDLVMLLLWDRLGGAPNSYLEESKARYGEDLWRRIGPDSLAAYLLPFPAYAYPFDDDHLVLRGSGAFPKRVAKRELKKQLQDYMWGLLPQNLFAAATVVVRARVLEVAVTARRNQDIIVDYRVDAQLEAIEALKGAAPAPLRLQYASFPRSPRLTQGEEVILFLSPSDAGLFLAHGKRSVYHVERGEVLETGQPLSEFVKQLRG